MNRRSIRSEERVLDTLGPSSILSQRYLQKPLLLQPLCEREQYPGDQSENGRRATRTNGQRDSAGVGALGTRMYQPAHEPDWGADQTAIRVVDYTLPQGECRSSIAR
jgi:hypothetical protein